MSIKLKATITATVGVSVGIGFCLATLTARGCSLRVGRLEGVEVRVGRDVAGHPADALDTFKGQLENAGESK